MPSMNFQSKDSLMALNYAMFRQNGSVGYVKKRFEDLKKIEKQRYLVTIDLISGEDLRRDKKSGGFYLKVWINGFKEDEEANCVHKVIPARNRSFYHPVFEDYRKHKRKKTNKGKILF